MQKLEQIIKRKHEIITQTPVKQFITIEQGRESTTILYKYDTPLHMPDVEIKHSRDFSLFELYNLSSLSIIFAYMFIVTNKVVKVEDKYVVIKRPSAKNLEAFTGVELAYQSPFINIYDSQDGASVVSTNNLFEVIATTMVRKRSKDKEP